MVHPAAAQVVVEVLRDPAAANEAGRDISRLVMTDTALSAVVLRAANSAHLGYSGRISSVRQATIMLGATLVGSLAAGRVADLVFDQSPNVYPDWLWLHSLAVGCSSAVVARHMGESVDDAYTVGILHDVGYLLEASARGPLGVASDHAELGADLLRRWNLPEAVVNAVRTHHLLVGSLAGTRIPLDQVPALSRAVVAGHAIADALGVPSPEHSEPLAAALSLVQLDHVRPGTIVSEAEVQLATLTTELGGSR
jgi:putative nucleotidyltransferase with HDIG domain